MNERLSAYWRQVVVSLLLGIGLGAPPAHAGWLVTQLTDDSLLVDEQKISGSNIVWKGRTASDPDWSEVYLYDGTTTTNISNNDISDYWPHVSGSNIAWYSSDGTPANDTEVFFYDGATVHQLTDNDVRDADPTLSGSNVAWEAFDGNDFEIFLYDGTTITQITDNDIDDRRAQVSGANIAWRQGDANTARDECEVFFYDGTTVTQLTDNAFYDHIPQVSGSNVVWHGDDGDDNEIFLYDGTTTVQLTNNSLYDEHPQVSGSNVVWYGYDGDDYEIFLYDGTTVHQLTDNDVRDDEVHVDGSNVVWRNPDGVFFYDGATTTQLTTNADGVRRPRVSGSNVVWRGSDGITTELFFARVTDQSHWTREGALGSGAWGVGVNWDTIAPAVAAEDVFVNNGGTARIDAAGAVARDLLIGNGSTVELLAGGALTVDSLTLSANGGGGTLFLNGGSLSAGSIANDGALQWLGGSIALTGPAGLTVGAGGLFGPALTLSGGRALSVTNALTVAPGALLLVAPDGALSVGALSNAGTLSVYASTVDFGSGLTNTGDAVFMGTTVSGPVHTPAGSTITILPGTVTFNDAVTGAGEFWGQGTSLFLGGYSPGDSPAEAFIEGSALFGPSNDLLIEILGRTQGDEHDWLNVGGDVALGGDLLLYLDEAFRSQVASGDEFILLSSGGNVSGSFANVPSGGWLPTTDGLGRFAVYYGPGSPYGAGNVVATNYSNAFFAIPEPGTLALLGLGLTALARRRRER
ncbi:PEP-CTERM sorting domain-containing protein [bacterium]|nr:PEP-CTERM sorting domain-containing protein [bacterium]